MEPNPGLTTKRIEALTDGIFAIAMTLLVLNIELPPLNQGMTVMGLHQLLFSQWYIFYNYALSFILLAVFWVIHHVQFHSIQRTDRVHLWINIVILLFIALVPFSTSLVGDFRGDSIAELFFNANLFIITLLFLLNWIYSTQNHRLVDKEMPEQHIKLGIKKSLVFPLAALFAMVLSFAAPGASGRVYLLIPFILFLPSFRR